MTRRRKLAAAAAFFLAVCAAFLLAHHYYYQQAYPLGYQELVERYSGKNGLEPSLTFAVIRTESSFEPCAQSSVGAKGLMQITEDTCDWAAWRMGEESDYDSLYDAETNIRYGCYILSLLLEEFGSEETALAAYHAGWGRVKEWLADSEYSPDGEHLSKIPYGDTRQYVRKVMDTKQIYEKLYHLSGQP